MKTRAKKIVIVAPVHRWDDVRVFSKEARSLRAGGYDVELIARTSESGVKEGVKVVPPLGLYGNRLFRFISLPLVALQALRMRGDFYHLHNPDSIVIGLFLALLRKKIVYDTHEDFRKRILIRGWIPEPFRKPLASIVDFAERGLARFSKCSIATQSDVAARLGPNAMVIANAVRHDREMLDRVKRKARRVRDQCDAFRLVYIGGVTLSRGLQEMVEALEFINEEFECRLWLIGPANENDLALVKEKKGWGYVDYKPRMPQEEAFSYVAASDVGLIYLRDEGGHAETDANKIYEYMMLGVPFVASDFPAWRANLSNVGAGVFLEPGSPLTLAKGVLELQEVGCAGRQDMASNGYEFILRNNWEREEKKLIKIYSEVW